jgi:hypothetical protein
MEDICIISDDNELDLNPAHRTARRYLHSSDNLEECLQRVLSNT